MKNMMINGFIEYKKDDTWICDREFGNIGKNIGHDPKVYASFFGVENKKFHFKPIVKHPRGIPEDLSEFVALGQFEHPDNTQRMTQKGWKKKFGKMSYIFLSEIQATNWSDKCKDPEVINRKRTLTKGVYEILDRMKIYGDKYGFENTRIVVWFEK